MSDEEKQYCEMCGAELLPEKEREEKFKSYEIYFANPYHGWPICSHQCQEKAIRFSGGWRLARDIFRNLPGMPYEAFRDHFGFPEDGGYARQKYEMMVQSPWHFSCTLDKANFKKLMEVS